VTGVVGAALARNGKAVAIVGDGAMLMNNEINTAVKYHVPAVWIVLNDNRYNMCAQGMAMLGMEADPIIPEADFVLIARGMGADGVRVTQESELEAALIQAMQATGPFVVDVRTDPTRPAPSRGRNQSLISQGVQSTLQAAKSVSFPLV
jgi:thiamine pyrophosphate-dependent acetolactate synthase large subunit-like protein